MFLLGLVGVGERERPNRQIELITASQVAADRSGVTRPGMPGLS
jgi:hypothetical protein